ncbi:hypothetical protein SPHINGOAX6_70810 [Sphingomonas sp. AX6]|nr:hypothetical protein SPHINGOAX6_70810 [Sphingomonas sp. AX6]
MAVAPTVSRRWLIVTACARWRITNRRCGSSTIPPRSSAPRGLRSMPARVIISSPWGRRSRKCSLTGSRGWAVRPALVSASAPVSISSPGLRTVRLSRCSICRWNGSIGSAVIRDVYGVVTWSMAPKSSESHATGGEHIRRSLTAPSGCSRDSPSRFPQYQAPALALNYRWVERGFTHHEATGCQEDT